jgi:hypothetical protein
MTTKTLHHSRPFLDVLDPTDLGIPQPQHLVSRSLGFDLSNQLQSRHLRHYLIGNDKINRALTAQYIERLLSGTRLKNPMPKILQHRHQQ